MFSFRHTRQHCLHLVSDGYYYPHVQNKIKFNLGYEDWCQEGGLVQSHAATMRKEKRPGKSLQYHQHVGNGHWCYSHLNGQHIQYGPSEITCLCFLFFV